MHILTLPFSLPSCMDSSSFAIPSTATDTARDHNPNPSLSQQHTTFLRRLSNGGSTVAETLWGSKGSQEVTVVAWNTEVRVYQGSQDGMCLIFLQFLLARRSASSMVPII